ncbi:MAG: hypothetical protein CM1200mP38_4250 [Dehalococcoidia bacterium]|nr:MAG: hypothetical protein CM1200mP38_4250 [Dehalococcoidia bacterium]
MTGITGARTNMSNNLQLLVLKFGNLLNSNFGRIWNFKKKHFQDVNQFADGAIIANAMLDAVNSAPMRIQ